MNPNSSTYADRIRARQEAMRRQNAGLGDRTVAKNRPGGTANYYDDSYGTVLDELLSSGAGDSGGVGGLLTKFLERYQGKPKHLDSFLENAAPFIGASLSGTEAFGRLQNLDVEDPLQQFGAQAAGIDRGAQIGTRRGNQSLATSGLGNSTMGASLARSTSAVAADQKSGAYNQLYQQRNVINRQAANSAFDAHRLVASLSLGHNPTPRIDPGSGQQNGQYAQAGGALLGTLISGINQGGGAKPTPGTDSP